MSSRGTAEDQLTRILNLLPLAGREGGASYDDLADALEISREQVVRDLEEVTARDFYLPAGSADLCIGLLADRVSILSGRHFQRPVRLKLAEAAALHLGLRLVATEREDPELLEILGEVEEQIAWAVPEEIATQVVVTGDSAAPDELRALVVRAAKEERRCAFRYLKPEAEQPEPRTVEPYVVVYSEGAWYTVGFCRDRRDCRTFRLDRILEAELLEDSFERPEDFDPSEYLSDGRVFQADEEVEVTVRYSPRVAPWLIERGQGQGERRIDGSVDVRHAVADPGWIVRHVLKYGADAEVLAPEDVRGLVREAAERVARSARSEASW